MEKLMTYETLRNFAYCNDKITKTPFRGIVLSFFGLNGRDMYDEDTELGKLYAEKGILLVVPYNNPWAWMNRQAVAYTDELIDVLMEHYHLPETLPIVSTGGSMGGLSCLVYTVYAGRTPTACAANCPVCDLPYHYTERPDLPRTLLSAFGEYSMPLEEAMKTASPLHIVDKMPDIPYYIVHCEADQAVNKQLHSDRFVARLSENHRVIYKSVPDRGHCDLTPEAAEELKAFILKYAK